MISKQMKINIKEKLSEMESNEGIEIIFAIESGSRLWDLASLNSDYDIRFIYKKPIIEYLKILDKKRDTVEYLDDVIDIVGWDIEKFLKLLRKSNPSALEWIQSNIIYIGDNSQFKKYLEYINPEKLYFHYRSLAYNQYQRYIEGKDDVIQKKYLYLIRGIVNALYVLEFGKVPNTKLLDTLSNLKIMKLPFEVNKIINELILKKKSGTELGKIKPINILNHLADLFFSNIEYHKSLLKESKLIDAEILNDEFLKTIGYK